MVIFGISGDIRYGSEKESLNSVSSGKMCVFQFFEYICLYIFKKDLFENISFGEPHWVCCSLL